MKKALVLLSSCTFYFSSFSQEPADALRYSWNVQGGTARAQAIGGAMGSLGGDITSTFVNPAGLAFYKTGDFVLTPLYTFQNTKGTYYGQTEAEKTNRLMLGTSGFVKGNSVNGKSIRSAAFSIAVNRSADFNGDILYRGENNQSSFSQQYVEELNNSGIRDSRAETDFPFGSSLAYNTYWIDATKNSAGQIENYYSNAPVATGLLQQRSVKNRGGVTELALGFAANSNDKLFFGGTIGVPFLNYHRETEFLEADATESTSNNFNYGLFKDDLRTSGIGLNLKAGLIYKPAEFWRLGLAVHSPTLYSLTENYSAQITTDNDQDTWTDESISYMDNQSSEFKYMLVTPYKVIGSVSYVLREIEDVTKQRGFITADVEFVNYKASSFLPDPDSYNREDDEEYLKSLNSAIDKAYKSAVNFRLGGELKFNVLMVRLGAAYYSNPYKDIHGEKGDKLNLSGGLGYRNKGFFADLTYVHAMNKDVNFAYRLENGLYTGANIRNTAGNVVATLGIKF
jgi:hypothetical protein